MTRKPVFTSEQQAAGKITRAKKAEERKQDTPPKGVPSKYWRWIPMRYRAKYVAAFTTNSQQAAIAAFCQQCVGYEQPIASVHKCTDPGCPLFKFRPYRHLTQNQKAEMENE